MTQRIVISEFMDDEAVASLRTDFDVVYDPELVDRPGELTALLSDADALVVRNRTQVTADLLDAGPRLVVVGRLGVGLDNIDTRACDERGIAVCPAVGANAIAVAEYVIGTMLMLLRGAYTSSDRVISGEWPRTELVGVEAAGRTLGLIGLGRIARDVAIRAGALGMHVIAHDPYLPPTHDAWEPVEQAPLADLLAASDVISIHVPLTPETENILDAAAFEQLKVGAIVINTSRGGIVSEEALLAGLRSGRVGAAAIDVFDREPVTAEAGRGFAGIPNLVLTPHIGGLTVESQRRVGELVATNVRRVLTQQRN